MQERKKAPLRLELNPAQLESRNKGRENNAAPAKAMQLMQQRADESSVNQPMERLQNLSGKKSGEPVLQAKTNQTGLPDQLKSGIENLSGMAMDDVKVHYNSNKPAQLQAHAYAQGTDIHVASGQEKHLAHEAWHVVQQKQGRVQATTQLKSKVAINDSPELEDEATKMGNKAAQLGSRKESQTAQLQRRTVGTGGRRVAQLGKTAPTHQEKIDGLNAKIEIANNEIEKIFKIKNALQTDGTFTPMNPAVYMGQMATTSDVSVDLDHSRLSAFSMLTKEHLNKQTKGNLTPEIQTAHVTTPAGSSVHVSGNTDRGNNRLRMPGAPTLGQFYIDKIRPISVQHRRDDLRRVIKKDYKSLRSRRQFVQSLVIPQEMITTPPVNAAALVGFVSKAVLRRNKRNDARRVSKSARRFAKEYGANRMYVPKNQGNIHAESAILRSMDDIQGTINQIGGTKVACLACMAYFEHEHQRHLLGQETGYAWISESSQAQLKELITTINSAESYLVAVYRQLQSQLANLKRYTGNSGDKKASHLMEEADIDASDSEDEDAIGQMDYKDVKLMADEAYKFHFQK